MYAIEPTPAWQDVARLVRENGLEAVVEVISAPMTELAPREVDFALLEPPLLEPLSCGLLEAADSLESWLSPAAILCPAAVRIWVAPVRATEAVKNARVALSRARRVAAQFEIGIGALESAVRRTVAFDTEGAVIGPKTLVCEVAVGRHERPEPREVEIEIAESGPVSGIRIGYEILLDESLTLEATFDGDSARRAIVCVWGREIEATAGTRIPVIMRFDEGRVVALPV